MDYKSNIYDEIDPDFSRNEYTYFSEIYSLFLNKIQDYTIKNLFIYNLDVAQEMVETFLLQSIPKFRVCRKNLNDINMECKFFYDKLDLEEKVILSDLMVLIWMDRTVNDITQMNLSLNDNDWRLCSISIIISPIYNESYV